MRCEQNVTFHRSVKKVKLADTRLPSVGFRSLTRFLAVSQQVTWVINPAAGCHYFPPGRQLPSQPLRGLLPILLLGEQRHDGCEQFAQDCYLTASRLRFEPGPFCAWVQHANHSATSLSVAGQMFASRRKLKASWSCFARRRAGHIVRSMSGPVVNGRSAIVTSLVTGDNYTVLPHVDSTSDRCVWCIYGTASGHLPLPPIPAPGASIPHNFVVSHSLFSTHSIFALSRQT